MKKCEVEATHLVIPYLTMARTTAFMPALSPPDVSTAIFVLDSSNIFDDGHVGDDDDEHGGGSRWGTSKSAKVTQKYIRLSEALSSEFGCHDATRPLATLVLLRQRRRRRRTQEGTDGDEGLNMVHHRINERETQPNKHINFVTALPMPNVPPPFSDEDARQLLRALAAQVRPIMKNHGFEVNSFEEVRSLWKCWGGSVRTPISS